MEELVSIIVTSYNHRKYLEQRMESLLHQTYVNKEIIVVDGGSDDGSVSFLNKYKKYPGIQIIDFEKHGGYVNASNFGVSLSKGEYIMFADCDDFNELTHVELLMNALVQNKTAGVAYSRSTLVDSNNNVIGDDFKYREKKFKEHCFQSTLIPKQKMQKFLLHSCVVSNMGSALIMKKYFNIVGQLFSSYKLCADWDLWNRLARACDFYYVALPLTNHRFHSTTLTNNVPDTLQISEIYRLSYESFSKQKLGLIDTYMFKLNIANIWFLYIRKGYMLWIKNFFTTLVKTIKYEKLSVFYLFIVCLCKACRFVVKKILGFFYYKKQEIQK